jgi:20S proteasome subunit beta 5
MNMCTVSTVVYYVDDEGTCIAGRCFCVGSGSRIAYSVLDSIRNLVDLDFQASVDLAERAIRQAASLDAYSGGLINIFFVNQTGHYHVKQIESRDASIKI